MNAQHKTYIKFQPTLPARGATLQVNVIFGIARLFQPTLPARGATHARPDTCRPYAYFNPRSPHGERRNGNGINGVRKQFQPTLPARGATTPISVTLRRQRFQPTLPARGATDAPFVDFDVIKRFQPTLPARGATRWGFAVPPRSAISTHAPRTGSDYITIGGSHGAIFQPTLPARGATPIGGQPRRRTVDFNPRSPHGERPRKVTILSTRIIGFAQKVYHKTVLLRIILAENAVILPKRPQNPVRTSLQKAGGLRFARVIRTRDSHARPYSISSPSGA